MKDSEVSEAMAQSVEEAMEHVLAVQRKVPPARKTSKEAAVEKTGATPSDPTLWRGRAWYDGNTFTCSRCSHAASSLAAFGQHARAAHGVQAGGGLAPGPGGRTAVRCVCHCCGEQVYHERRALTQHLRARHCLSLAEYHRLYARLVGGVTVHYYDQKKKDVIKDTANMKKQRVAEVEPMEPLLLCCPFPSCQFAISPKDGERGCGARHCLEKHGLAAHLRRLPWPASSIEHHLERLHGEGT